jgi:glucosamine 6-phosphate synthetase-like amidotransferase/phosphosugar isomerase protein
MCGICAYIGENNSFDYVYNGIQSLLNRGYDSIGISTININNPEIFVTDKYANENAYNKILENKSNHIGNISIGHCRWATSGLKTDNNAHPHQDINNLFSIIHNGTIDNYNEIKQFLINEDNKFIFKSETDTEVIVNLISYYYCKLSNKEYIEREKNIDISDIIITSIQLAIKHFNENSTYSLVIICKYTPDTLYCFRNGTPLLIGYDENKSMTMIVSERYGFNNNIKKYAPINNNDFVIIKYIDTSLKNKCKIGVYSLNNDIMIESYISYLNNKKYNNDVNNNSSIINTNKEISNYIFNKLLNNIKIHKKISSFKKRYKYDMVQLINEINIQSINNSILLNDIDLNKIINNVNLYSDNNINSLNYDYNILKNTWTFREIMEQPESLKNTICNGRRIYKDDNIKLGGLNNHIDILLEITDLILLGCGSSYNSALISSKYFKELCVFNTVQVFDGSEFTLNDIAKSSKSKTGIIFITQSGETKDLYDCLKLCNNYKDDINNKNKIITIGVVNVVDSMIARETLCGVYLNCGKENAVASTKSITCQIVALALIALWFSQYQSSSLTLMNELLRVKYINDIKKLSEQIEELLKANTTSSNDLSKYKHDYNSLLKIFNSISDENRFKDKLKDSCFIIDKTYAVALEGSLKFKEISYIMAEGKTGSSLKHGPFSILKNDFPVIIINNFNNNNKKDYLKMNTIIEEIKSREATIIKITDTEIDMYSHNNNNEIIFLVPKNECFSDIISIVVLQLMSVFLSVERNNNIDKPRNLAKTVTV